MGTSSLLLALIVNQVDAQTYHIAYGDVTSCSSTQFFNGATLRCEDCPANSARGGDSGACVCNAYYRSVYTVSGSEGEKLQVLACQLCPSGATTADKSQCVTCDLTLGVDPVTGFCTCPGDEVLVEYDSSGALKPSPECVACDSRNELSEQSCQRCPMNWPLEVLGVSDTCGCDNQVNGVCLANQAGSDGSTQRNIRRGGSSRDSSYLDTHLFDAYRGCKEGRNATKCNQLANMCILQLADNGACDLLGKAGIETEITDRNDWKQNMPWIGPFRQADYAMITEDVSITTTFTFTTQLDLLAAVYEMDGTFVGYHEINQGLIQLCPYPEPQLNAAWSFAAPYSTRCTRPASAMWSRQTQFFELFMRFTDDQGEKRLFPIVVNAKCDGTCPNSIRQSTPSQAFYQYTRRFFLADTVGGVENGVDGLTAVRVAKSMQLKMAYRRDGGIYPPRLLITYTDLLDQTGDVELDFSVVYEGEGSASETWRITTR